MSIATQFRWKRAINDLKYIHEEYALIKEVANGTAPEFQKYYEEFCTKHNIDIRELNSKHAERVKKAYGIEDENDLKKISEQEALKESLIDACDAMIAKFQGNETEETSPPPVDEKIHETFAKLFKAIASHIHPDKARDEKTRILYEQKFKEAKESLDSQKYFTLLEMAEELDIKLPTNYNEQIEWMKDEGKRLRAMVQQQMRTYNYLFAECDSDENRDNIIRSFLKQLFNFDAP